ncbi:hypothetical protein BH10PSE16_BH10PSE16_05660 [soil metagenome]
MHLWEQTACSMHRFETRRQVRTFLGEMKQHAVM